MAGEVAYLYNDYVKDLVAASITVINEDTDYPKTNMQNEKVSACSRTSNKTNIRIQFTLAASKPIKAISINNHNFAAGNVKIYSYTNADFATGQVLEATVAVRAKDMFTRIASPNTRTYWEIDLSKNGTVTSASAYYEWGRAMLYDDFVLFTEIEDFEKERRRRYRNIINRTPYGVRWVHKMTPGLEGFGLFWSIRDQVNMPDEMITLHDAVNGGAHPFVLIENIDSTDCYYVFIEGEELAWREVGGELTTDIVTGVSLRLEEEVRGKA